MPVNNGGGGAGGGVADGSLDQAKTVSGSRAMTFPNAWVPGLGLQTTAREVISGGVALTSGTLRLTGGVVIPRGVTVTSITMVSTASAFVSPTHQWFCLVDKSLNVLAKTTDDTTTAWGGSTAKTLNLSATYTPTSDIAVYVGVLLTGTSGTVLASPGGGGLPASAVSPIVAATSTTGLTDPASLGATAGALTAVAQSHWAYLS